MSSQAQPATSASNSVPKSTPPSGSASKTASSSSLSPSTSPSTSEDHDAAVTFPALTTHWSKPLSCTWTYVIDQSEPSLPTPGAVAWLDLEPEPGASTLSCYPDGMFEDGRTGVFSPATCPHGWTTASILVNTNEPPDEATTTAVCCSSEYSLDPDDTAHCKRSVPTVLAVPISYNVTASTHDVLISSTTTLYSATIAVNTIRALFRQDDKTLLGITDETSISEEVDTPSHSLSMGARIGIGIGVTVFVLLLIGGGLFFFLYRRRSSRLQQEVLLMQERRRQGLANGSGSPYLPRNSHHGSQGRSPRAGGFNSTAETDSLADTDSGKSRGDQMQDLVAQKAAIQRRIEELEKGDSDENRDTDRNK